MNDPSKLPPLYLEQARLDELSPGVKERRAAALASEETAEALRELDASNARFLAEHPPSGAAVAIRSRSARLSHQSGRARRTRLMVAAATALTVALVVGWWFTRPAAIGLDESGVADESGTEDDALKDALARNDVRKSIVPDDGVEDPEGLRDKGLQPHMEIHRKERPGGSVRLSEGAAVGASDLLQLSYVSAGRSHGVLFSIDGRSVVTLHFPSGRAGATNLRGGGAVALDHSYELDDAPRFERFFMVSSNAPIAVEQILQAGESLARTGNAETGALVLPPHFDISSVTLRKVDR